MPGYDIAIIGSGPAGYTAAFEAIKKGLKTALIEKDMENLGGVCLNEGCIPLKGYLHYSSMGYNYKSIREIVAEKIKIIKSGLMSRLEKGADIINGEARFESKDAIRVRNDTITSKYVLIAAGASPKRIFNNPCVYTSDKIYRLESLPQKILIIGGGAIGCEYASFFNNLGKDVTIVELLDSLIHGEEEEAVRTLTREFKKKKITVYTKSKIVEIKKENEVVIDTADRQKTEKYNIIFETTGRKPVADSLQLDRAGVTLTDKNFIKVNDYMRTDVSNIYAVGDCIDTPMLAYTAYGEAETAISHITSGTAIPVDYSQIPRLVFSSPQVGSIGINENTAGKKGIDYKIHKYFFKAIGKAVVEGKDAGFLKLIADTDRNEIIGASAVGHEIVDIINELCIIINNRIKVDDIRRCMHIHPSYSEIIMDALNHGG